jgi:NADH:ubiquinone reductase (non-electrogenic)
MARQRLVVIGSGWVGLYIAQYIDTNIYSVTIISPRRTSAYTPLLASAACGFFPFSCAEESLRAKGRDISFFKAYALSVDFEKRVVTCEPAFDESLKEQTFDVEYDKLVISPGCTFERLRRAKSHVLIFLGQTNTFGTPGVEEHALFMKNVFDAMVLRKLLFDQLEKASLPNISREQARGLLHIAIVGGGGGPTGKMTSYLLLNQQNGPNMFLNSRS